MMDIGIAFRHGRVAVGVALGARPDPGMPGQCCEGGTNKAEAMQDVSLPPEGGVNALNISRDEGGPPRVLKHRANRTCLAGID